MTVPQGGGPQILEQLHTSLPYTVYDAKWVPSSAKVVALGSRPRMTGVLEVYEMEGTEMRRVAGAEQPHGLKCGTFGASSLTERHLAAGDLGGQLQTLDLERPEAPVFRVQAHKGVVHAVDGFGGQASGCGAPELVSCGQDCAVRVWDPRQPDAPVAAFVPEAGEGGRLQDCWCVAIGNSFNDQERCVLAGYDNGDVKMFDLRTNSVRWEGNLGAGVVGLQFDRRDIPMNKFAAACMDSRLALFDARTQHPSRGFAHRVEKLPAGATLWTVQHLPQNRDVFMVGAGDGSLALYKYHYPDKRVAKEGGEAMGVVGTIERLAVHGLSSQPVAAFDWHPDRAGLFACAAFDQRIVVGAVTRVHSL